MVLVWGWGEWPGVALGISINKGPEYAIVPIVAALKTVTPTLGVRL